MAVPPAIAALRNDPVPQRLAQQRLGAAHAAWRSDCGLDELEKQLGDFAAGADPNTRPTLAALFTSDDTAAREVIAKLVSHFAAALMEHQLGQLPLRHRSDDLAATLILARSGTAALSLQAIDAAGLARRPPQSSAVFQPVQSIARVITGMGSARLVHLTSRRCVVTPLDLRKGMVLRFDGSRETLLIDRIEGPLLLLKLQRQAPGSKAAAEYDLESGALLRQAAGSARESRLELATALLGRMGRSDAVPGLAAIAREPGSAQLRWHALRQCLALDSRTGFTALLGIAASPTDSLAIPAQQLRDQLISNHPEFAKAIPCPA